jgi:hypothetical protein
VPGILSTVHDLQLLGGEIVQKPPKTP